MFLPSRSCRKEEKGVRKLLHTHISHLFSHSLTLITKFFLSISNNHYYLSSLSLSEGTHPDLDGGSSSSTQPVPVGAEAEGVDGVSVVQGVQVLVIIQVPQHSLGVLKHNKGQVRSRGYYLDHT